MNNLANLANRYRIVQPLKQMTNGQIVRGKDVTSERDVLLYIFQESDALAHEEVLRWMRKASQISNEFFMQMLDFGSEEGTLYAVLRAESGSLLSDRLNDVEITGNKALTYVHELAIAIREAQLKQQLAYSVDVNNLWITDHGKLRIMNRWTEGSNGRRGAPGLGLLLYQLAAKSDIPTSSMSAYSFEMGLLFADMAEAKRERAVALACKAYEGLCTLEDFRLELEIILGISGEKRELHDQSYAKPSTFSEKKAIRKWPLIAFAGVCVLVLVLFLSMRPHEDYANDAKKPTTAMTDPASVSTSVEDSSKSSAAPTPDRTLTPSAKPVDAQNQPSPAGDSAEQDDHGVVPDLVNRTKEEAEKMALDAGLRYEFFLESSSAAQGTVFKQDIPPGTAIHNGDRITFWVSKGL
ncbi:PASTA domain-containing protein [Paenibacillus sp. CGMCC 1.16610]|uniref:PASTA domain-containing protein n=1 Tax=Paenibacillus anseongense TaxID=2682845 RepID=A0ABW9UIN6_9BACL|nr:MULTISPECIES: PASTA domain-containing protein [Paenibacillus]MBA2941242.1 PASTA domain-containing protein [Paenibacillus sp. CGMCC 1.16610]MVQ40062.1 PASTA domain-containing protein [Paenibacillus anseongense]